MKLSVIVPIYHPYFFDDIIDTYAWQDAPKEDYEVLFMLTIPDPDPLRVTIGRVAKQAKLPWKVFNVTGDSNCLARNKGTKLAQGDVVLFIDGDQLIAPHLFTRHMRLHSVPLSNAIGIGICNINIVRRENSFEILMPMRRGQTLTRSLIVNGSAKEFVRGLYVSQAIGFADWHNMDCSSDYINVVGRNISIKRLRFIDLGMWDETLAYSKETSSRGWEDLELGLRCFENKLKFEMVPSWTVHMEHPSMSKDNGIENIVKVVKTYPWFLERDDWWAIRYNRDEIKQKAGL